MAVLNDAQKQQIAAKYYQIFQQYQNDPAAYINAKAQFEQSLSDEEKDYYTSIAGFKGQEDPSAYWGRIEKLAGGGAVGQLATGPDGRPTTLGGQVTQQMSEFLNYLNQPVDLNSPFSRQVLMSAQRGSQQGSYNRGLGTEGFANTQAQQAYMGAALGLEQQRQANLLQALGLGSGRDIGLQGQDLARQRFAEDQYQFNVGQEYKQYQQNQQNQMAGLGLVGGIGGAVVGGLTGGPAGVMPGAQVGSQAFAGLGGLMYPTFSAPQRF
jgi:hypothetical protein